MQNMRSCVREEGDETSPVNLQRKRGRSHLIWVRLQIELSEREKIIDFAESKLRLQKKIKVLDKKLERLDETLEEEYRKALDAYSKIVKKSSLSLVRCSIQAPESFEPKLLLLLR